MDKLNVAIYSRKSRFVEGSESIENQIEMCKEYISKNIKNADDIVVYEDEGFSGGNIDRPNFSKMMKDAKDRKFDILICYRLDRVSRNIADFTDIIKELQNLNIDFISIKEQFDTSSPMGRAMMYISSVFAQLERETIAERVTDNLIELAKTGKWLGGNVPLGYKKVGVGKDAILEIDEEYANLTKKIFDKYIECNSLFKVHKWTIENDIKSKSGNYFHLNTIKKILVNPVFCVADSTFYNYAKSNAMLIFNSEDEFKKNSKYGVMCFNKSNQRKGKFGKRLKSEWIVAIGKHKGIIKSKDWVTVQEMITDNASKAPRSGTAREALLSGMLKCEKCGGSFRVICNYRNGVRKQHYYKCNTKANSSLHLCNVKNINGLKADADVIERLLRLNKNEKLIDELYGINKDEFNNSDLKELKELEKILDKKNNNIEKLLDELMEDEESSSSKYIRRKIDKIDLEIKELNEKINNIKARQNNIDKEKINLDIVKQNIKYLTDNINTLSFEDKKSILARIIKVIYWDGKDLKIKLKQ